MSNSPLVDHVNLSPNRTAPRGKPITKITIHHMAGNLSVESCGSVFASTARQASSNYAIDGNGRVGMYVEEKNRAWTSSSTANDNQAVTIEVANSAVGGDCPVSDKAYAKLLDLCEDICRRNNIPKLVYDGTPNGSLTHYQMFASTSCPGPYLLKRFPEICAEVNKRLDEEDEEVTQEQFEAMYAAMMSKNAKGDTPSPWAKEACEAAKAAGVFQGDGNGNYGWQNPIDRESLAVVLHRAGLIEG